MPPIKQYPILIHGDILKELDVLSSDGIRCVITDPPYGISYTSKYSKRKLKKELVNDGDMTVGQILVDRCFEIGVPICTFAKGIKPFAGDWKQYLIWDKGGATGMGSLATTWKPTWELIQLSNFGKLNGGRDEAILRFPINGQSLYWHPTQKPVKLLCYLIEKLTQENDIVCDPFMGSGSVGVACMMTKRRFIGVEIDDNYFKISQTRILRPIEARMEEMGKRQKLTYEVICPDS